VVEVGGGDLPVAVADRVALPRLGHACGYCQTPQYMGYTMDGGYAEYALAYASHVVKVPEGVSSFDAAPTPAPA
jgi:alcohol dehydrogenase, propanol-preferring